MPQILALSPGKDRQQFELLDAGQLLKHILGLTLAYGKRKFKLLYLYMDTIGPLSVAHEREVESSDNLIGDDVEFRWAKYRDLISRLVSICADCADDSLYTDYLTGR